MKKWMFLCSLAVAAVSLAQTTKVPITAKFTYDDGTPVAATIAIYNDQTDAVISSQQLDSTGKLATTLQLDPALSYRVMGTNNTNGNPFPKMLKTINLPAPLVQQIFSVLGTSEVDVVLAKADDDLVSYSLVDLSGKKK